MAPEIEVSMDLVCALLTDQAPHVGPLAITSVASGWDNAVLRLGDAYAVRLPVRAAAAQLVDHEQRWLPWWLLTSTSRCHSLSSMVLRDRDIRGPGAWCRGSTG